MNDIVLNHFIIQLSGVDPEDFITEHSIEDVTHVYKRAITGFAASLSNAELESIATDERVVSIDPDAIAEPDAIALQDTAGWGLDMLDDPSYPSDYSLGYSRDGVGVDMYIIDGSIYPSHPDFEDNEFIEGYGFDHNNYIAHATSVASCAVGKRSGVAKRATLISVVGDTTAMYVDAADWIIQHHQLRNRPGVVTLSMTWNTTVQSVIDATQAIIDAGIHFFTSVGNNGTEVTTELPQSMVDVFSIGAYDRNLGRFSSSNWGSLVDIWGPGVYVFLANSTQGYGISYGTSFATPYVSGVAALILQEEPDLTYTELKQRLIDYSAVGVLSGLDVTDNNRIVQIPDVIRDTGVIHSTFSLSSVTLQEPAGIPKLYLRRIT